MYSFRNPLGRLLKGATGSGSDIISSWPVATPLDNSTASPFLYSFDSTPTPPNSFAAWELIMLWFNIKTATLATPIGSGIYDATIKNPDPSLPSPWIREYGIWPFGDDPQSPFENISMFFNGTPGTEATLGISFGGTSDDSVPDTFYPNIFCSVSDASSNSSSTTGTGSLTGELNILNESFDLFADGPNGVAGDCTFTITSFWYP